MYISGSNRKMTKRWIRYIYTNVHSSKGCKMKHEFLSVILGLLICTLISKNQSPNPRKNSGSATLFFFQISTLKKTGFILKREKNPGAKPKKKSRSAGPEIFLGFEIDLDFSRPWFSEIRVQIKRQSLKQDWKITAVGLSMLKHLYMFSKFNKDQNCD